MSRTRTITGAGDVQEGFSLGTPPELNEGGFDAGDIETVPAHRMGSAVETEKFMNEKVVIEIDAADDENAPVFVYLGHNGVTQYVKRGEPQVVKRKYLYSALAAKHIRIAVAFGKDGSGREFNRDNKSATPTHRVHLVKDDNPQGGMAWVQSVMRAAA